MENQNLSNKVIIKNREQLKAFFKNNKLPNENHFAILIDSMFIKREDGISINEEDSLMIFPTGDEQKLLSFYDDIKATKASWVIVNSKGARKGLILRENDNEWPTIYFGEGGNVGIGTDYPKCKLEVDGFIASKGRMGTYKQGNLKADRSWSTLIKSDELKGCEAFEIIASVGGTDEKGKYALIYAIVISTFGNSRSKISKTCAHYGYWWEWWNNIRLRWKKVEGKSELKIRTNRNFGEGVKIHFKISKLWDQSFIK